MTMVARLRGPSFIRLGLCYGVVHRNTAYVSRLLLKSSDLSIVPFYGQFVGVIKVIEPPPQQNTQIPSYAVVGAGYAGLRAWFTR
jgi:hypothetical protein